MGLMMLWFAVRDSGGGDAALAEGIQINFDASDISCDKRFGRKY
jgi:hypothetical protein